MNVLLGIGREALPRSSFALHSRLDRFDTSHALGSRSLYHSRLERSSQASQVAQINSGSDRKQTKFDTFEAKLLTKDNIRYFPSTLNKRFHFPSLSAPPSHPLTSSTLPTILPHFLPFLFLPFAPPLLVPFFSPTSSPSFLPLSLPTALEVSAFPPPSPAFESNTPLEISGLVGADSSISSPSPSS